MDNKIIIIHSEIKSQPYQRYLGFQKAESDILFLPFLDDDMEIANSDFPEEIIARFSKDSLSGLNLKFVNKNVYHSKKSRSIFYSFRNGNTSKFIRWAFGYPVLLPNKFSWNGNKGVRTDNLEIEYVSGGCFCSKKEMHV